MLFNSLIFIVFAIIFFSLWPLLNRNKASRWAFIILASLVFYGWWNPYFIIILAFVCVITYSSAIAIIKYPKKKKIYLGLSITCVLGSLIIFKYFDFLIQNTNSLLALADLKNLPVIKLALPIGISFYTFQSLSYVFDVYKKRLAPAENILHYSAYVCMFPQLISGPINRGGQMLPQLAEYNRPTEQQKWEGFKLLVYGYFKKAVIADNIVQAVGVAFDGPIFYHSLPYWWINVSLFAVQIYCDFSGYTDISRGLAKWMGFEYTLNFNHPYMASGIRDFWNRWHISLTTWFRDYIFLGLGGAFHGVASGLRNLLITFLLCGLWHGASWNFIIWGGLHASYITIEQLTKWPKKLRRLPGGKFITTFLTLFQVLVAWVFFRSQSLSQAISILGTMLDFSKLSMVKLYQVSSITWIFLCLVVVKEIFQYIVHNEEILSRNKLWQAVEPYWIALLISSCIFLRGNGSAFVYFKF